jgi:hypothetical protein
LFNPEYGAYSRNGSDATLYRGVLSGNCYKWQLQNHNCAPGEVAINNGVSWVCMTQATGTDASRSAVKANALRRTGVMPIRKK